MLQQEEGGGLTSNNFCIFGKNYLLLTQEQHEEKVSCSDSIAW